MASYLEVKQQLKRILCLDMDMDENCDINIPVSEEINIILSNHSLKEAFDKMQSYEKDNLEISTAVYREIVLNIPNFRNILEPILINDSINGIDYSMGPASLEYCMFLLNSIVESIKANGPRICVDLRHGSRKVLKRNDISDYINKPLDILPQILRVCTLTVRTTKSASISHLRDYASAFEFQFMYKRNVAISEYIDVQDIYSINASIFCFSSENADILPQRIYNTDVLDYYAMAMESRDPFIIYISYYHIIEHYFDAIFRRKLAERIQEKITHPDFSYRSEEKLYALAKYIRTQMSNDDDLGKGKELDSLKFVLMEYVPIEELKNRIDYLDSNAIHYYQNTLVPFTTSNKTKIAWTDNQGVYTNLANRIYETRNALVHSKSEQLDNQYKPYKNKKELVLEITLIKAVAELVLINSSEIL